MLGEPLICSTSTFVICHQPSINLMSLLPLVLGVVSELYVILSPVSEEGSFIKPKYRLHWLHWTVGVVSVFLLSYYIYIYI